jgi:hypothetical protein
MKKVKGQNILSKVVSGTLPMDLRKARKENKANPGLINSGLPRLGDRPNQTTRAYTETMKKRVFGSK